MSDNVFGVQIIYLRRFSVYNSDKSSYLHDSIYTNTHTVCTHTHIHRLFYSGKTLPLQYASLLFTISLNFLYRTNKMHKATMRMRKIGTTIWKRYFRVGIVVVAVIIVVVVVGPGKIKYTNLNVD